MNKVSCNVIRDLLPLYIDGVASDDSESMIKEHLASCEECSREYDRMKIELVVKESSKINQQSIEAFENFGKRIKLKRIVTALIAALCTAIIFICAYFAFLDRGALMEYLTPSIEVSLKNIDASDNWKQVRVGDSGYLNFNSRFYKMHIMPGAGADYTVSMRISDLNGNVIKEFTLESGKGVSLEDLERNTDYKVEIMTDDKFVFFTFD